MGHYRIHPHIFFETLAYVIAFRVYLSLRRRFGDPIPTPIRWVVIAAAIAGAALGSKLLFWLEDPRLTSHNLDNPAYLMGGKTIVGALIFGLIAVELMKRYIGVHQSTGDLYAIPLALGIAIGRIGCFLTGLSDNTYGTPTNLPWAINFGDGIPRWKKCGGWSRKRSVIRTMCWFTRAAAALRGSPGWGRTFLKYRKSKNLCSRDECQFGRACRGGAALIRSSEDGLVGRET